jgi:glycosyltransferase involved in cell wall biosynthesis
VSKDFIFMSVYNRPPLVLAYTLRALSKGNLADTRIVIVDDGSTVDYGPVKEAFQGIVPEENWLRCDTCSEHDDVYQIDGSNNPAHAFNVALQAFIDGEEERCFWLSSDVVLPPGLLDHARQAVSADLVFTPKVVDMDTAAVFNSTERPWPMPWFLGACRDIVVGAGLYDLTYLYGMGFEDNDHLGKLAMAGGNILIDNRFVAYHQSHEQIAYSDNLAGFKKSEEYTTSKWGGIPFRPDSNPLPLSRLSGEQILALRVAEDFVPPGMDKEELARIQECRAVIERRREERRKANASGGDS